VSPGKTSANGFTVAVARSRLIFHPEAAREVEEARDWYLERSPSAEEGFLAELDHAVEQIASSPLRWPRFKVNARRYVFRQYPYSLIYRTNGDSLVRILAVAHDSRHPNYWLARAKSH
jgi:plasmid stabilization system protein ParE